MPLSGAGTPRATLITASPGSDNMKGIEREVAILGDLSYPDMAMRWEVVHGAPPPKGMSGRLLLLALAYRLQVDAYGALDSKTGRYLRAVAAGSPEAVRPLPALKTGMRLMREWNGRTHVVDVTEEGLLWSGETYPSLSAIARAITGARWSGPRFFGLRGQGA